MNKKAKNIKKMNTCVKSRPLQKIKFTPIDNRPKALTPNNSDVIVLRGTKVTVNRPAGKRPNEHQSPNENAKRRLFDNDEDVGMALPQDFPFDDKLGDLPDDLNEIWGVPDDDMKEENFKIIFF